jgi:hypothetical protein
MSYDKKIGNKIFVNKLAVDFHHMQHSSFYWIILISQFPDDIGKYREIIKNDKSI